MDGRGHVIVLVTLLVRHEFVLVERLRAAQADLAERSRAEERNRIARELHDVIAHSLTVSLLHVTSARLAVEHDPADASRALAEAERLGRQSLTEVRATMGLLRPAPARASPPPVPGAGQLPELVEQLRDAGADVSLVIDGDIDGGAGHDRVDRLPHRAGGAHQCDQARTRLPGARRVGRTARQGRGGRGQRRPANRAGRAWAWTA